METPLAATTDTKARILAEAERLFAAKGYDGVSMRQIAEACGTTKANIYYHFKDKDALYLAVLQADMLDLVNALHQASSDGASCRERITNIAQVYWDLMRDKSSLIQITMRQFGGLEREIRGLVHGFRDQLVQPIQRVLEEGIQKGELRDQDTRLAAVSLIGMMSVFITQYVLDIPISDSPEEAVSHTVTLFFDGAAAAG